MSAPPPRARAASPLTPDAPGGRRKTLWVVQDSAESVASFAFVLAGYGDAWATIELARGMGPRFTVFALQPPDDDIEFESVATVQRLAAVYVQQLRARQPHGPYSLGGYSAGALVALEMARLLRGQGETIAQLLMFDPLIVQYTRLEQRSYRLLEMVVAALAPVARRTRPWKIMAAMVQDRGLMRHMQVLRGSRPAPYDGAITLIEAQGSRFVRPPTFLRDLRRVAVHGLERWRVRGTHHAFMRPPHVHRLGRELGERIIAATSVRASG